MKRSASRLVLLLALVALGLGLGAQRARPMPGGIASPADTNPQWNQAEIVFVGELTDAQTGAATMSLPPIFLNRLTFKVEKTLRGTLDGNTLSCPHSYRGDTNFPYQTGKKYIVALSGAQQTLAVRDLKLADDAAVKDVELACSLPLGWKIANGKAASPWAAMGKAAWSAEMPADVAKPKLVCDTTGRPALMAGSAVEWKVEPVPPAKSIQWTNPDGDGGYELTLTNPTDKPLVVPALLTQDGKPLWRECVVILCQGKAYACPGAAGVVGKVAPLTLKPAQSVSTIVNAFALHGPDWPQGGYRIEFTFCLGEKARTASFYYMARHHDALRAAAQKSAAENVRPPAKTEAPKTRPAK